MSKLSPQGGSSLAPGSRRKDNGEIVISSKSDSFIVVSDLMTISAEKAVSIKKILEGKNGQSLKLIFEDSKITLVDNNTSEKDTINLGGPFTGSKDAVLCLVFNGVSWRESSRSMN